MGNQSMRRGSQKYLYLLNLGGCTSSGVRLHVYVRPSTPSRAKRQKGGRRGKLVTGHWYGSKPVNPANRWLKASLNWLLAVHPIEGSVRFGIDQRKLSCKPESPLTL